MIFLLLLVFLSPLSVRGQNAGSLPVRVLDRSGAVVAGATVTVRNVETGLERTQTTASVRLGRLRSSPARQVLNPSRRLRL
jgi:hypothetical protein